MPTFVRPVLLALALASGAAPSIAWAQTAGNGDRCSGTLCDFYYGNAAPAPSGTASSPPPANGQTPLTVPGTGFLGKLFSGGDAAPPAAPGAAPAAPHPMVQVQGGGLLGRVTGAPPPERCSGTLCDFYYGGPASEPVEPAQQAGASEPAPEPAADDTAPARPRRRVVEEKPDCVSPANDPWRCYRK